MAIEEYRDHTGSVRKLGWLAPSNDEHRMMRAATTSIQQYREQRGLSPLEPKEKWSPVDYVSPFQPIVNDQRDCSGCTGWSGVQAFRRMRLMRGMEDQDFSGAFAYAQINRGSDRGSVIVDCQESLATIGVCLRSEFDYPKLFKRDIPASAYATAKRFRLLHKVYVDNSLECATALQMGMIPCVPIRVDGALERFDGNGVAGVSRGTQGNHAVHLAGMVQIAGRWYFLMPNTWGLDWGPFVRSKPAWAGCCLLDFASIDNCDYENDGYSQADGTWDRHGDKP